MGEMSMQEDRILRMKCFNDGLEHVYLKKDIINFTSQMTSLTDSGVEVEYGFLTDRKSIPALFKAGLKLRRVLKERKIDIVHVHWGVTTSLMAVVSSQVPVVISFCGSDLYGSIRRNGGKGISSKTSGVISQFSGLFASRIIVKSRDMLNTLWEPNKRKATVIANGINMELFSPMDRVKARQYLSWNIDEKYILFFPGGGAPVKDPELARAAFAYVKERIAGCNLVFVENVPHEDLVWYYNAADVLLITSFHEGSNNSLKEAMCCNLPIVSVMCGDARERLRSAERCWVVEERSPETVGKALLEVVGEGTRSNGRRFMNELHLGNVACEIVKVYKTVLKEE